MLFEMGLMGIDVPEAYGGAGGSFFQACIAVEELSRADAAVGFWLEALRGARRELSTARGAVSAGHGGLLKQRALGALLRRLDATLFAGLLEAPPAAGTSSGTSLPPALLPCDPAKPLSFATGVPLKLAAGRLADWATSVGVRAPVTTAGNAPEGDDPVAAEAAAADAGTASLFPCLRGAADLLMMPKAALAADAGLRAAVAPGLSPGAALALLSRSEPDEDGDGGGGRLLAALSKEAGPGGLDAAITASRAAADAWPPGVADPPAEAALAADAALADPLSLEMDAASGDELDALGVAAVGEGGTSDGMPLPRRYELLRELWASAR
jgi:hypothetical protein